MPLTHGANRQIQPVIDLALRERRQQRSRDVWQRKQKLRNNAVIIFKPLEYLFPKGANPEALFMGAKQPATATETSAKWMALPNEGYDFGYVVPPSRSSARSRVLSSIPESLLFGPFPKDERTSTSTPPLSTRHSKSNSPRRSIGPSSSSRATPSPSRRCSAPSSSRTGPLTRQRDHPGTSSARAGAHESAHTHTRFRRQQQKHHGTPSPSQKAALPSEIEQTSMKELQASSQQFAMEQEEAHYGKPEPCQYGGPTLYAQVGQSNRGEEHYGKPELFQHQAPTSYAQGGQLPIGKGHYREPEPFQHGAPTSYARGGQLHREKDYYREPEPCQHGAPTSYAQGGQPRRGKEHYSQQESYQHGRRTLYAQDGQLHRKKGHYGQQESYRHGRQTPYMPEEQSRKRVTPCHNNQHGSMTDTGESQQHYKEHYACELASSSQVPHAGKNPALLSAWQQPQARPVVSGYAYASGQYPNSAADSMHVPQTYAPEPHNSVEPHSGPGDFGEGSYFSQQAKYHRPNAPILRNSPPRTGRQVAAAPTPKIHPSALSSYQRAAPPTSAIALTPRASSYNASPSPPQSERAANVHPHPHDMLYEYAEQSSVGIRRRRHPEYENIPTPHVRKTVSVCVPREVRRRPDFQAVSPAAHHPASPSSPNNALVRDFNPAGDSGVREPYPGNTSSRERNRDRSGSSTANNQPHGDNSSKSPDSSVSRAVWAYDKPNVKRINGVLYTSRAHGRGAHTWVTTSESYGKHTRQSPSSSPCSGRERGGRE